MVTTPPGRQKPAADGDWKSLHLWQIQGVRDILIGMAIFGLLWLGQKTSVVTVPLLLAVLFAYLFEPVIVWGMRRLKISRPTAVGGIIALAVVCVAIPATIGGSIGAVQLGRFVGRTIEGATTVSAALDAPRAESRRSPAPRAGSGSGVGAEVGRGAGTEPAAGPEREVGPDPEAGTESQPRPEADTGVATEPGAAADRGDTSGEANQAQQAAYPPEVAKLGRFWRWVFDAIRDSQRRDTVVGDALDAGVDWIDDNKDQIAQSVAVFGVETANRVMQFLGTFFGATFTVFVTAFFFYFVATEWVKLKGFGSRLLPERNKDQVMHLLRRFDQVISGFIRGRLTIAFLQAFVFSLGYFVIGVPGAFILGPAIAVLSIVPYLALVGVPISVALIAIQSPEGFRGEWWWVLGAPIGFYFIAQSLDDYVWTPLIQGKSTGMDTPTILFASLAGGAIFGVFGLLIAIPIAACVKILIQEVVWPRFKAWAEGRERDFLPISRE